MEVRIFTEPLHFELWVTGLNYTPEELQLTVWQDTLIVTFKRRY